MTMFSRQAVMVGVVALVAGSAGFGLAHWMQQKPSLDSTVAPAANGSLEGRPLPAFTINDLDGKPRSVTEWRGKWLLLNFWATWCAPCITELPALVAAQQRYGAAGLQVLGVAMDDPEPVRRMVREKGLNYPTLAGDDAVQAVLEQLGNTMGAIPFSVLVGPEGVIRYIEMGGVDAAKLDMLMHRFLPPP